MMAEEVHTLVVDDEKGIRFFLEETLRTIGHVVVTASNGEEALALLQESALDVVMLDLRLGGRIDGMRVLEAIRWRWPETAVIILTAHASLESALAAIREGVDGYLLKPVEPGELRLAVQEALARRKRPPQRRTKEGQGLLQQGPLSVDLGKNLVAFHDQRLELTSAEFKLLAHLMRNAKRVISPVELVRVVRGYECEDLYEARQIIKWYIYSLRRKVEPVPSNPCHILNVRGVGYRFRE